MECKVNSERNVNQIYSKISVTVIQYCKILIFVHIPPELFHSGTSILSEIDMNSDWHAWVFLICDTKADSSKAPCGLDFMKDNFYDWSGNVCCALAIFSRHKKKFLGWDSWVPNLHGGSWDPKSEFHQERTKWQHFNLMKQKVYNSPPTTIVHQKDTQQWTPFSISF